MSVTLIAFILSVTTVLAIPTGRTCNIHELNVTNVYYQCVGNDTQPSLQDLLNGKSSTDVLCSNKEKLSKIISCLLNDILGCLSYGEELLDIFPDETRLLDGIGFICDNKKQLVDNKCMGSTQLAHMQCLVSKLFSLKKAVGEPSKDNIQKAVCSMFKIQETCYDRFHGNCTREDLQLAFQVYAKLFRLDVCKRTGLIQLESENQALTSLLRSLILPYKAPAIRPDVTPAYEIVP